MIYQWHIIEKSIACPWSTIGNLQTHPIAWKNQEKRKFRPHKNQTCSETSCAEEHARSCASRWNLFFFMRGARGEARGSPLAAQDNTAFLPDFPWTSIIYYTLVPRKQYVPLDMMPSSIYISNLGCPGNICTNDEITANEVGRLRRPTSSAVLRP